MHLIFTILGKELGRQPGIPNARLLALTGCVSNPRRRRLT